MATTQMVRQETGWSTIFPTEQVTEQQSALFVKKLLAVAVSNVTYLRAIFPEYAFGDRCLEDLNLKILRDDSECPGACQVIRWVKGCFDALEKKYLKMLIIGIYTDPDDPETIIESYTFKFSYANEGGVDIYRNKKKISSAHSAAETKKATIRLLRTIVILTQSLQSLPDDVMMTMKLLYFDEVTPIDYEPPGFKPSDSDNFKFQDEPMNISVGDVLTPFHTLKMRIKTDASQFDQDDEDEDVADVTTAGKINNVQEKEIDVYEFDKSELEIPHSPSRQRNQNRARQEAADQCVVQGDGPASNNGVRCPCGCNEDDGLMILCARCNLWQHAICFKIIDEEDAPGTHYCELCVKEMKDGTQCTDQYLQPLSPLSVQATCLWRRALHACTEGTRIVAPKFAKRLGVEMAVARGLMTRLENEGCLKNAAKGKRLGKVVQEDKLKENIGIYFRMSGSVQKMEQREEVNKENIEERRIPAVEMGQGDQIDKLSVQAEKLNISERWQSRSKLSARNKKRGTDIQNTDLNVSNSAALRPVVEEDAIVPEKKKGKKRKLAKINQVMFNMSDSQDLQDFNESSKRIKKSSVSAESIMV